jgi:hypothetical protein
MNMNFLPKDLRYQETDLHSSYNHLLGKHQRLVNALDGMAKKKDSRGPEPKKDGDFRLIPPPRASQGLNPVPQEPSIIDSLLMRFGCIKR